MLGPLQELGIKLSLLLFSQGNDLESLLPDLSEAFLDGKTPFDAGLKRTLKPFSEAGFRGVKATGVGSVGTLHRIHG
ncbi:MAG: hypothetical protein FJ403_01025 [Verrucomicrobia bacterium]|nr:hypothetical protein [Verrucomicrobiota bacterium]